MIEFINDIAANIDPDWAASSWVNLKSGPNLISWVTIIMAIIWIIVSNIIVPKIFIVFMFILPFPNHPKTIKYKNEIYD